MKSTKTQLHSRGFVFEEDIEPYKDYRENELLDLLYDKDAFKRTISVRLLSKKPKEKYIPVFCEMLKSGEKLYTKLELQSTLKEYGEKALPYLVPLLGTIGNNQHKKIEIVDIKKKSYPCPRDIVAMILIRIGPTVFPELDKLLKEDKERIQINEAIDVIGHITWNFHDYSMGKTLLEYYAKHKNDEFIQWKIIRAFQSFNSEEMIKILKDIIKRHKNKVSAIKTADTNTIDDIEMSSISKVIAEEAKRSLNRIENRK